MATVKLRSFFICLYHLQFQKVMRYLHRKKIIILTYHGFTDKESDEAGNYMRPLHLDVKKFRSQIEYLKRFYNVISLDQLTDHYISGSRIPDNSVVITVDDGYRSSYTLAYPVLKEFNAPASIFLTTDFIDKKEVLWLDRIEYAINRARCDSFNLKIGNEALWFDSRDINSKRACYAEISSRLKIMPQGLRDAVVGDLERTLGGKLSIDDDMPEVYRPLEWNEILEMIKSGIISIGSHTSSHVILTRCNAENMEKELLLSRKIMEERTGLEHRLFCYPNGEAGDFDNRTKKLLGKFGYSCGLTTIAGMNDEHSDVFELKRLHISRNVDLIVFIMILSGAFKFLLDIKHSVSNYHKVLR